MLKRVLKKKASVHFMNSKNKGTVIVSVENSDLQLHSCAN